MLSTMGGFVRRSESVTVGVSITAVSGENLTGKSSLLGGLVAKTSTIS
jgi:predicted ATPase